MIFDLAADEALTSQNATARALKNEIFYEHYFYEKILVFFIFLCHGFVAF